MAESNQPKLIKRYLKNVKMPRGICKFPSIAAPDRDPKYGGNKFKIKVLVDDVHPAVPKIEEMLLNFAKEAFPDAGIKNISDVSMPFYPDSKSEGFYTFNAKSNEQHPPKVYKGDWETPAEPDIISHGNIVQCRVTVGNFWRTGQEKKNGRLVDTYYPALNFYLDGVLFIEEGEASSTSANVDFDDPEPIGGRKPTDDSDQF
jgi:hypothetical protein